MRIQALKSFSRLRATDQQGADKDPGGELLAAARTVVRKEFTGNQWASSRDRRTGRSDNIKDNGMLTC